LSPRRDDVDRVKQGDEVFSVTLTRHGSSVGRAGVKGCGFSHFRHDSVVG